MTERTIDYSRYRLAETIAERWAAGESAEDIGLDYFVGTLGGVAFSSMSSWIVELIVAAHDRKGKFEPKGIL